MRRIPLPRRCGPCPAPLAGAILLAATGACPAAAAPGGPISTLPLGHYQCELPGDALGPAGIRQPEAEFTITFGSTYRMADRQGTYLLTGEHVTFTAGPMKGAQFQRAGVTFLRQVSADGTSGRLRCIRQGATPR